MNYKDKVQMAKLYEQKQLTENIIRKTASLPIEEQKEVITNLWGQLNESQQNQLINEFDFSKIGGMIKNIGGQVLGNLSNSGTAGGLAGSANKTTPPTGQSNSMTQAPGGTQGQAGGFIQNLFKMIPPQAYQGIMQKIMSFLPMDKIMPIITSIMSGMGGQNGATASAPTAQTEQYLRKVYNQLNESQQQELLEFWQALLAPAASALGGILGKQKQGWAKGIGNAVSKVGDMFGGSWAGNLVGKKNQQQAGQSQQGGQPQQAVQGQQLDGLFNAAAQLMQSNPQFAQQVQQLIQKFVGQGAQQGQPQQMAMARTAKPTSYSYSGGGVPK